MFRESLKNLLTWLRPRKAEQKSVEQLIVELQEKLDAMAQDTQRREHNLVRAVKQSLKSTGKLHDLLFRLGNSGNGVSADMMELPQVCWQHLVPVKEPLVLISQVPRSGGTLLNELFDGHLECHAHPYELSIGPTKDKWPLLDLNDSPERWFDVLFEPSTVESFQRGYQKYGPGKDKNRETFRFLFLPSVQKELFLKYVTGLQITSPRQAFDAYMTSYFNAWLNNHNVEEDKKAVVAFTPWLATDEENVRRFFDVYPDGKLISILRSPQSWYVSARLTPAFETQMTDIVSAMRPWEESAQAMRRNKHKYGERVCLLSFENLVDKTEAVMRYLADYVGIKFDEILLTPTFNKCPIKANSSYKVKTYGVIHEPVTRHLEILTKAEIETIENLTGELYESVSKEVTQI